MDIGLPDQNLCQEGNETDTPVKELEEKKHMALFLLKTTAVNKVSKTALNDLIGDITLLLERKTAKLQKDFIATLASKSIEFDDDFAGIFKNPSLTTPFEGLQSKYMRKKFFKEEMKLLV